MTKKCRICGMLVGKRRRRNLISDLSLNYRVQRFLHIDVHQYDGLTHIMCVKCKRKVNNMEEFYESSKKVQSELLKERLRSDELRRSKQLPKKRRRRRRVAPLSDVTNVHPVPGTSSSDASQIHGNGPTLAVPPDSRNDNDRIRGPITIELAMNPKQIPRNKLKNKF